MDLEGAQLGDLDLEVQLTRLPQLLLQVSFLFGGRLDMFKYVHKERNVSYKHYIYDTNCPTLLTSSLMSSIDKSVPHRIFSKSVNVGYRSYCKMITVLFNVFHIE